MTDKQEGINVILAKQNSNITKFNVFTKNVEEKFKIRGLALLGESDKSLVNWKYEDVLFLLLYKKKPNEKDRSSINQKIKKAYKLDFSYQFKLLEENIDNFKEKPFILAEMLLLSLSLLNLNEICYTTLFTQCFARTGL